LEIKELTEIVRRAQGGDSHAQQELYLANSKSVYFLAFKILRNKEDAEDITQDVFATVFERLPELKQPAAYIKWVNQITSNKCLNYLSRKKPVLADDLDVLEILDLDEGEENATPEKLYDDEETRRIILEIIDALPDAQRICVMYRYFNQFSIEEIAALTGANEHTVKSRLALARQKIRAAILEKEEKEGIRLHVLIPIMPVLMKALDDFQMPEGAQARMWENIQKSVSSGADRPENSGDAPQNGSASGVSGANIAMKAGMTVKTKIIMGIFVAAVITAGVIFIPRLINTAPETTPPAVTDTMAPTPGNTDSREPNTEQPIISNTDNQLSVATYIKEMPPLAAGYDSSLFLQDDGVLLACGNYGINTSLYPTEIMSGVKAVSTKGKEAWFVIKNDESLWGWGNNKNGLLGDIEKTVFDSEVKILDDVAAVSCGYSHVMAIKIDGSLWEWGSGNDTPAKIMDSVMAISAGNGHSMAVMSDGSLWAWGYNKYGQLGDGTNENRSDPVKIMDDVIAVSAGNTHTMAIKADGSLWAWGDNKYGLLGDGTENESLIPIKIMDNAAAVSAGSAHTLAIKTDGSLWSWGRTSVSGGTPIPGKGDLGPSPEKIMDNVAVVSVGAAHSVIMKTDGSVWTWGVNSWGLLGNNTKDSKEKPDKIMDALND
jgi:RNA polymerase sigma factor (sigma-70 family)